MKHKNRHPEGGLSNLRSILVFWMVMFLAGATSPAKATDKVILRAGVEGYPLGHHLLYLEDKTGQLTLSDVIAADASQTFLPSQAETPNFGFTPSTYWFRLDLHNENAPASQWLLENGYPPLDHIDVHLVYPGGRIVSYQGGHKLPFLARAIKHRHVMFNVPLAKGESVAVFIRVQTESSLQMPMALWSPQGLLDRDHEEQYLLGIFYGIFIAMLLFNFMLFLSIRDISYLFYVQYIFGWILFQMSLNGLAFEYLWPDFPWWGSVARPFFVGFCYSATIQFSRHFLELKKNLPKVDILFRIHYWAFVLLMIRAFFPGYTTVMQLATFTAMTGTVLIFVTGILCLKKGVLQAKFFMIAWSVYLVFIFIYVLKTFGLMPNFFLTEYGLQIGSTLEAVLLSFALAHKMRLLKLENERIQRNATEMLEMRVQQRTHELDLALHHLADANEKLTSLNHTDGLTGVKNRAYFDEMLELEWRRALRAHTPIGLLILDIDHFKSINDTYGHLGGDVCLKKVAETIRLAAGRAGDQVFRYGGEEFVVVLPNTNAQGAAHVGEVIRSRIEALAIAIDGKAVSITVSVGVSSMIPDGILLRDSLIGNADNAMYNAKNNGRNQVCIFAGTASLSNAIAPSTAATAAPRFQEVDGKAAC